MADSNPFESDQPRREVAHSNSSDAVPASSQNGHSAHADGSPGDDAVGNIWEQIYDELHDLARAYMAREDRRVTLQPTALVHEAFVKLSRQSADTLRCRDREHFFRIAASAMRQILVDHARRRRAADRHRSTYIIEPQASSDRPARDFDVIELDSAMSELACLDERKSKVVELRFFAGLTGRQIADALGISPKTVEADWYFSRSWLRRKLSVGTADGS